jgi:hypothetical protein
MTKSSVKPKNSEESGSRKTKLTSQRLLPNRPVDPDPSPPGDAKKPNVKAAFAEAAKLVPPENVEPPKQAELLAAPEAAARPAAVQNGRIHAMYNGLGLERDKDGEKFVHLDFSFILELGMHDGEVDLIPEKVLVAWNYLKQSGEKGVMLNGIPPVTFDVWLEPKAKKPELHLAGAEFSKAIVQVVEEVGKGKAKKVTRFAFRLLVERDEDVIEFAAWRDGEEFWLTMPETQGKL